MTWVLHTHSRRLDYHPHIHFVVPGGALHRGLREWRKHRGHYLFKQQNLAKVFRARLLKALNETGLDCPPSPTQWVVDCREVGRGLPALQYLSRYLYRGVISDQQILHDDGQTVTFRYQNGQSGEWQQRALPGEDLIALLLQHILPKGFRRVRNYRFLHGNAKHWLQLLQLILKVVAPTGQPSARPPFLCSQCQHPLHIVGFIRPRAASG